MKYLIIPGLNGSSEKHWQSLWEKRLDSIRLEQENWNEPLLEDWLKVLNEAVENCSDDLILVAHSLGCALVLNWAQRYTNDKVKAALLVAPADVDLKECTPDIVRNFAPMPLIKLSFSSIVVASENDPYMSITRAQSFATVWGSSLINVGKLGHINVDSQIGEWDFGYKILKSLNP